MAATFGWSVVLTLPLTAVLGSVILLHVGWLAQQRPRLCLKLKTAVLGYSAQHATHTDLYSALAGKVAAVCMPIWSPYKWNFEDPNWHAKWINLFQPAVHRSSQRPAGEVDSLRSTYTAPSREKWRHFACTFGDLTSGISKIWKKCLLLSAPNWHAKWINLFRPAVQRSSQCPAGEVD